MLGTQPAGESIRPHLLTQSFRGEFQLRCGQWKYLDHRGSGGNRYDRGLMLAYALPERAPDAAGQLYDLAADPGETDNLFYAREDRREQMRSLLDELKKCGRSAPVNRAPIGLEGIAAAAAARRR